MKANLSVPLIVIVFAVSGCSIKRTAVDMVGDAISGGNGVYSSDGHPDLVREAIPFGLKTYESLLAVDPDHQGLLLAAASGFVGYGYILGQEADRLDATDLADARALRGRASKLFLRGRDYAMRGLDVAHPGFTAAFARDPAAALALTRKPDAPLLYWPGAGALVARVLELDETYDAGSAHEFFVTYEGSRPGGSVAEARRHYARALELSRGNRASVYLSLAEAVSVHEQNPREFQNLIHSALAIDPDRVPELRLVNTLAIRRAQWLETRIPDLFVTAELTE